MCQLAVDLLEELDVLLYLVSSGCASVSCYIIEVVFEKQTKQILFVIFWHSRQALDALNPKSV